MYETHGRTRCLYTHGSVITCRKPEMHIADRKWLDKTETNHTQVQKQLVIARYVKWHWPLGQIFMTLTTITLCGLLVKRNINISTVILRGIFRQRRLHGDSIVVYLGRVFCCHCNIERNFCLRLLIRLGRYHAKQVTPTRRGLGGAQWALSKRCRKVRVGNLRETS